VPYSWRGAGKPAPPAIPGGAGFPAKTRIPVSLNSDNDRIYFKVNTKLCIASPMFYPTYGGSTLRFVRYLPGLRQRGIEIRILTGTPLLEEAGGAGDVDRWQEYPVGKMLPLETVHDTPVHRIRLPESKGWMRSILFNRALLRHCRNPVYRPDVVQMIGALRLKSIPWLARLRAMGIPCVYAVTITSKLKQKTNRSVLQQVLTGRQWRYRHLFNYLDCIVANNSPMRDLMREMGVTTRIEVIQNGVNLQRFRLSDASGDERQNMRAKLGVRPDELMITTVGAVIPRKGSDLLLESWIRMSREMKNTHLVFVGPEKHQEHPGLTEFRRRMQELMASAEMPERIHFTGLTEDVPAYLQASDLFVLPSQREGMPNSVIEAMACGVPTIITPFLGLSDDLGTPGRHYLLSDANPEKLAGDMHKVLSDPVMRKSFSEAGRQWVEQTMDLENTLDRYADLYHELAGLRSTGKQG
jgi:glycosyltransferase involved in cell wall biosynthesis